MKKMKKLFAVVLALAMLFSLATFSASADASPTVAVTSAETVSAGDDLEVVVTPQNVGGVDGTLSYDSTSFEYVSATFENEVYNTEADSIKDDKNGSIRIILVESSATLTFKAKAEVEGATFAFVVNAASDANGTEKYGANEVTCTPATVTVTAPSYKIEMLGATIRSKNKIDNQDLGFIGRVTVPEDAILKEFGIIVAFTNDLTNVTDFTLDTMTDLNVNDKTVVARKAVTKADAIDAVINAEGWFRSHVKLTDSYDLMGKNLTARFYAIFEVDGAEKTVYSNNKHMNHRDVVTANNGVSNSSIVKVLASLMTDICNNENAPAGLGEQAQTLVDNYNKDKKSTENKQALLNFVDLNKELLDESVLNGYKK